jgi:hypothetical protein
MTIITAYAAVKLIAPVPAVCRNRLAASVGAPTAFVNGLFQIYIGSQLRYLIHPRKPVLGLAVPAPSLVLFLTEDEAAAVTLPPVLAVRTLVPATAFEGTSACFRELQRAQPSRHRCRRTFGPRTQFLRALPRGVGALVIATPSAIRIFEGVLSLCSENCFIDEFT